MLLLARRFILTVKLEYREIPSYEGAASELLRVHPIGGGLRLAGGGEHRARIVLHHVELGCNVGSILGARFMGAFQDWPSRSCPSIRR